jgi:calmodulin
MKKKNPKILDKEITKVMERMDTNGDGNIDFKEFAAMEIFKQFDVDNDGEITAAEFKGGLNRMNPTMSEKDIEMLFKSMDSNGDGVIDFSEFDSLWQPNFLTVKYPEAYKPIRELFRLFDADGDGYITKTEFKNAMKKEDPKLTDKSIEAIIGRVDTNSDGNIDFKEFAAMEFFKQFDVDNDGEITAAEFKSGMSRLNPTMFLKEVEAIFRQMDGNGDGRVDYKEFDAAWHSSILEPRKAESGAGSELKAEIYSIREEFSRRMEMLEKR